MDVQKKEQCLKMVFGGMELIKVKSHIHKSLSEEGRVSLNNSIAPLEDERLLI